MSWVVSHPSCWCLRWPSSCLLPDDVTLRHPNSLFWKLLLEASSCKQATFSTLLKSSEKSETLAIIRRLIYFIWCHGHHGHLTLALEHVNSSTRGWWFLEMCECPPQAGSARAHLAGRVLLPVGVFFAHDYKPHAHSESAKMKMIWGN